MTQQSGDAEYSTGRAMPYQPGALQSLPEHPQAIVVLVLGIVGLTVVPFTAPFAWVLGSRALREIDADPGAYSRRDFVVAGRILGIVGTVVFALVLLLILFFVVFGSAAGA